MRTLIKTSMKQLMRTKLFWFFVLLAPLLSTLILRSRIDFTIAQDAEITYEYRSDDRDALAEMRRRFFTLIEERKNDRVRWTAEGIGDRPCGRAADPEEEQRLLERCSRAVAAATGTKPALRASSTDCNIPFSRGIPATAFGLYLGADSHTREEYVERASLQTGLEIGLLLLTDLAGI